MNAPELAIGDGGLGRAGGRFPHAPTAAVLTTQDDERAELPSQAVSIKGQSRDPRHLAG